MANFITRQIPNLITLGNLICGCYSLLFAFSGDLKMAGFLIFLAAFLDFFDGLAARMLGVSSPIGKELDSLADCVTFGVAPAFIGLFLSSTSMYAASERPVVALPFLFVAAMAAMRLAIFNVDTRQTNSFIGVPSPANGLFWASLPFLQWTSPTLLPLAGNYSFFATLAIVMGVSMVIPVEMLALKFKNYRLKGNVFRYLIILISLVLLGLFSFQAIPIIILCYICLSIVNNFIAP